MSRIQIDTKELDRLIRQTPGKTKELVKSLAFVVEGEAKTHAPVDTGALRASINTTQHNEDTYWIMDGVEYGIFQELGTSRMSGHPFMVPAVEIAGQRIPELARKLFT